MVPLEGIISFRKGDNPEWKHASLGDDAWESRPPSRDDALSHINLPGGKSWIKIKFVLGPDLEYPRPAVFLGRIGDAHEIYLNGAKIGGQGNMGSWFVEAPSRAWVYPLPRQLLNIPGQNVLAARILNTNISGPFFELPVWLGNYPILYSKVLDRNFSQKAVEISFITLFTIFLLVASFICVSGLRNSEYTLFLVLMATYLLLYIVESNLFYDTGLKTPWTQRVSFVLSMCIPPVVLLFLFSVNRIKVYRFVRYLIAISVCHGLIISLVPTYRFYNFLIIFYIPLFSCFAGVGLFIAVKSLLNKRSESAPVLFGMTGLALPIVIDSAAVFGTGVHRSLQYYDFGFTFFLISMAYALMKRYVRTYKGYQRLSQMILTAHEEERIRLSRDIHDGVGQALLGVKLHLQVVNETARKQNKETLSSLGDIITEVSNCSEELRAIAMDLQPGFLKRHSLFELLKWYGKKFESRTGITVHMKGGDDRLDVPDSFKDNIYRICQEALGNIAKHSGSTIAVIYMAVKDWRMIIEIRDNGCGFDPFTPDVLNAGVGLMSMKERSRLIGGVFSIQSESAKGCTIKVEIPVYGKNYHR